MSVTGFACCHERTVAVIKRKTTIGFISIQPPADDANCIPELVPGPGTVYGYTGTDRGT